MADDEMERRVTELVDQLASPMFMFRMSRANPKMSAATLQKSIEDMDAIVRKWIRKATPSTVFSKSEVAMDYLARLAIERPECYGNPAYFPAKLAEETGEAVREGNKRIGFSRHLPDQDKEAEELADVIISAYAQAIMAGINLDSAIQAKHTVLMSRDWKVDHS
jgi:NTP pyrophosphatase (non-canonical NTP hydrolase)